MIEVTYRTHFTFHLIEDGVFHYFEPVGLIYNSLRRKACIFYTGKREEEEEEGEALFL